jgi:hypothetical protein
MSANAARPFFAGLRNRAGAHGLPPLRFPVPVSRPWASVERRAKSRRCDVCASAKNRKCAVALQAVDAENPCGRVQRSKRACPCSAPVARFFRTPGRRGTQYRRRRDTKDSAHVSRRSSRFADPLTARPRRRDPCRNQWTRSTVDYDPIAESSASPCMSSTGQAGDVTLEQDMGVGVDQTGHDGDPGEVDDCGILVGRLEGESSSNMDSSHRKTLERADRTLSGSAQQGARPGVLASCLVQ